MRYAFLDESGNPSFSKLGRSAGTTDHFVVAVLLVDDPVPVIAAMEDLKGRLGMRAAAEFRFSKMDAARRSAVLETLRRHQVVVRALAVNKVLVAQRPESAAKELFYTAMVRRALVYHRDALGETRLTVDEYIRGRTAQRAFDALIRQVVNTAGTRRLVEIKHQQSETHALLQAADAVAGAIYQDRAQGDARYLEIIQPRVQEIRDWGGSDDEVDGALLDAASRLTEPGSKSARRRRKAKRT